MKHISGEAHSPSIRRIGPFWANAVRGPLLIVDVIVGGLLAKLGFSGLMIPLDEGGPLSAELPMALLCLLSAALGLWLMVSGVLLVSLKQPKCWQTGVWTHRLIALGIFLFIPAMFYQSEYEMQVRPGHTAMQSAAGTGILSIGLIILAALWLAAAFVLKRIAESEEPQERTG